MDRGLFLIFLAIACAVVFTTIHYDQNHPQRTTIVTVDSCQYVVAPDGVCHYERCTYPHVLNVNIIPREYEDAKETDN